MSEEEKKDRQEDVPSEQTTLLPSPNISADNGNQNSSFCCSKITLLFWFQFILLALILAAYFSLRINSQQNYNRLNDRLEAFQRRLADAEAKNEENNNVFAKEISSFKKKENDDFITTKHHFQEIDLNLHNNFSSIHGELDFHNKQLIRLLNGTSNAEVLDKIKSTKQELNNEMKQTIDKVDSHMEHIKADIDDILFETKHEIHDDIEAAKHNISVELLNNHLALVKTQAKVSLEMNNTVDRMKTEVKSAIIHIQDVQNNVTNKISVMEAEVGATVNDLTNSVDSAKVKIHQEVQKIQGNIDQYVAFTNEQFQTENDFVKYQLAGTFTLLGCLISLWHLTSHLRHYYKPDVQRRIMAVLWMVPIYGVTSWLSLVFPPGEPFFGVVRDCYEAYVIYTFIAFLIAILEDGKGLRALVFSLRDRVIEEKKEIEDYEKLLKLHKDHASGRIPVITTTELDLEQQPLVPYSRTNSESGHSHHSGSYQSTGDSPASPLQSFNPVNIEETINPTPGSTSTNRVPINISSIPPLTLPPLPDSKPVRHIVPPCSCCYDRDNDIKVAALWLHQCQFMAMQFVLLKPLLTIIPLVLSYSNVYDIDEVPMVKEGTHSVNWLSPKLYVFLLENISVAIAFYGLLHFFHGAEKDLEWCNPWPKFLCIKGVVFATFWQNMVIQLMSSSGLVDGKSADQIQNLLICIEMLLASIAHFYIFPYHEWEEGYKPEKQSRIRIRDTLALNDFGQDFRRMMFRWDTQERQQGSGSNADLAGGIEGKSLGSGDKLVLKVENSGIEAKEMDYKDLLELAVSEDSGPNNIGITHLELQVEPGFKGENEGMEGEVQNREYRSESYISPSTSEFLNLSTPGTNGVDSRKETFSSDDSPFNFTGQEDNFPHQFPMEDNKTHELKVLDQIKVDNDVDKNDNNTDNIVINKNSSLIDENDGIEEYVDNYELVNTGNLSENKDGEDIKLHEDGENYILNEDKNEISSFEKIPSGEISVDIKEKNDELDNYDELPLTGYTNGR